MHTLIRSKNENTWRSTEVTALAELPHLLEPGWSKLEVFPEHGPGWTWLEGEAEPAPNRRSLPVVVRLAWFGMRHPEFRWRFQLLCWFLLIAALALPVFGVRFHAGWYTLPGALNVFAWWWWESDKGRIQPLEPRVELVTS
ncbi:MAG: hypothetical protein HC933_01385 [Pleurocapsa sp. SU_196_0]|nr:hypothetical protein [Pleurocapsa sp. SU_196_0]